MYKLVRTSSKSSTILGGSFGIIQTGLSAIKMLNYVGWNLHSYKTSLSIIRMFKCVGGSFVFVQTGLSRVRMFNSPGSKLFTYINWFEHC
jgi:hypothetical protein